jgi:hypothetical protein
MGMDKRRQVVGHSYGPSRRSQLVFFVTVGVGLVVLIGGFLLLVSLFDQAPDSFPDKAPWSHPADTPEQVAEQDVEPLSPLGPCGEPGNVYPTPAGSPCASGVSSVGEPLPAKSTSGGTTGSSGSAAK